MLAKIVCGHFELDGLKPGVEVGELTFFAGS
jgi:hypothetical protein